MISNQQNMCLQLKDKIVIVTGGSQGIGEEICYEFAKQGAKIAIADINADKGLSVVEKIKKNGNEAIYLETDATKSDLVEKCVSNVLKNYKTIDVLVNCVGYNLFLAFDEITNEKFENLIKLNLYSQWYFCKYVIPTMKEKKEGKIINISSGGGVLGIPKALPYSTAKCGVIGLTRALAIDMGPFNINVNCIAPGSVYTPQLYETVNENFRKKMIERYPIPRLGKPSDIAKAALFLASSSSDWITGIVLPVDGGLTCSIRAHHIE